MGDEERKTSYGKISTFHKGNWETYTEQLEFYFIANRVEDLKTKKAILLANLSPEIYQLLKDLLMPAKPSDEAITYEVIVASLKRHVQPDKSALVARFDFDNRTRKDGESIKEYVAVLKHLASECKFNENMRNERLRDRLVSGVHDDRMLRDLLKEKLEELTFEKAVTKCLAHEQASKDVHAFKGDGGQATAKVQLLNSAKPTQRRRRSNKNSSRQQSVNNELDTKRRENKCTRCGDMHDSKSCKFKQAKCYHCGKTGHISKVCRSKEQSVHALQCSDDDFSSSELYHLKTNVDKRKPMYVDVTVEGYPLHMEVDTGSAVTVINEGNYRQHLRHIPLKNTHLQLHTYTGQTVKPTGWCTVTVKYEKQEKELPVYVVPGDGPTLLGREWLREITLNWTLLKLNAMESDGLTDVLKKHRAVFGDDLGCLKDIKAKFTLNSNAKPKFCKPRPVALARKQAIEKELVRLEAEGILKKITHSDWAAPIVTPIKKDGSVRICGDFKVTVNPYLEVDVYPLPLIDDIYASLNGGTVFSVLDLKQAYLQMEVDEASRKYVTINTHRGLYEYQRMPYGIASAPALWQRAMDQVLQGIDGVQCYIDDIIISGKTQEEHLKTMDKVLERLEENGLRANRDKCSILKNSVEYCGHIISSEGLRQSPKKVKAIVDMPAPKDTTQLRSFLGMVQYYARFLPDLSTHLGPLHRLLVKDQPWNWGKEQEESFTRVKDLLTRDRVLTHFNPDLSVVVATDSSSYGLGAVLSHVMPDGSERPIAYASRTLTATEKKYAQIEKEALSIVWGVKKFQSYLEGRHFKLLTDHKPLKFIMDPTKATPVTSAARIQRWCIFLGAFSYEIAHRGTKEHANCDGLSRLPQAVAPEDHTDSVGLYYANVIDTLPVTDTDLRRETRRDPCLSRVLTLVMDGWDTPETSPELRHYATRKGELVVHEGILMWGSRVVVPPKLRRKVLDILHEGHLGMVKMKGLGRGYVWWPGIDKEIEEQVKRCVGCQQVANNPTPVPLHRWEYPASVWQRIQVDFAGPYKGSMWMVVEDAHSKWPEVFLMKCTTAAETVSTLRTLFARMGIPEQVVSDNGPQFTSAEFKQFMELNGIRHIMGATYHPATNGLAERFVQSFKRAVKADQTHRDLQHKLDRYLMAYRTAPHATTGQSPAQLFLGRNLRTRLDLLKPNLKRRLDQKIHRDVNKPTKVFSKGQKMWVRNFLRGPKWIPGEIIKPLGPVLYQVSVKDGMVWKRHVDQLRTRLVDHIPDDDVAAPEVSNLLPPSPLPENGAEPKDSTRREIPQPEVQPEEAAQPTTTEIGQTTNKDDFPEGTTTTEIGQTTNKDSSPKGTTAMKTTRCGRVVRPPSRYGDTN